MAKLGVEKFQQFTQIGDRFALINGTLYLKEGKQLREIPSICRRREILKDLHEVGGHVGIGKLYNMAKGYYYWKHLFWDCI